MPPFVNVMKRNDEVFRMLRKLVIVKQILPSCVMRDAWILLRRLKFNLYVGVQGAVVLPYLFRLRLVIATC